jgi:lipoyl(octanoyl) transferase
MNPFQDFDQYYEFSKEFAITVEGSILFATAEKIDYERCLFWQKECLQFIRQHHKLKIFFIVSHPNVLTVGRGLQKKAGGTTLEGLVEQDYTALKLPFPLYTIKRGGGMTFHHPGQVICYPIVSLNFWSLKQLTLDLLSWSETFALECDSELKLEGKLNPLGLWHGMHKIASIGIGVEHFVTHHGLAFNLYRDDDMFAWLKSAFPCGLSGNTYRSLEDIVNRPCAKNSWNIYATSFQQIILKALSIK